MKTLLRIFSLLIALPLVPAVAAANWPTDPTVNVPVAATTGDQVHMAATSDGAGGAIIVWEDARGVDRDIYAQRMSNLGVPMWAANGVVVCNATGDQTYPKVVSDGSGGAIVGWLDQRGVTVDVYAQRIDGSGATQWAANGVLCSGSTGKSQAELNMSARAGGGAHLVWGNAPTSAGGVFVQSVGPSGSILWGASGRTVSGGTSGLRAPGVVGEPDGSAIVAWHDQGHRVIYADRVSSVGDTPWGPAMQVFPTSSSTEPSLVISTDGLGGAIIASAAGGVTITAERLDSTAVRLWGKTNNGITICSTVGSRFTPAIVPNNAGAAVIAWQDARADSGSIYGQRIGTTGVAQWATNGIPLSSTSGTQRQPALCLVSGGNILVSWVDGPAASHDVLDQVVSPAGTLLGVQAVSTAPANQDSFVVVPDGLGGAILAWMDLRTPVQATDIYAQRVGFLGAPAGIPTIDSFSPPSAPTGSSVTILGSGLLGASEVDFGGIPAAFVVDSDTQIHATAPTCGLIRVVAPGGIVTSSAEFGSTPAVIDASPSSAMVGTAIQITGYCFTNVSAVSFNGTPCSSYSVVSPTTIIAVVPGSSTTGPISVTNDVGTAVLPGDFTVEQPATEAEGCYYAPPFAAYSAGAGSHDVALADLDGDGQLDMITADTQAGTVSVRLGIGNGAFGPRHAYAAGSMPLSIVVGDLNEDGLPDIAVANSNAGTISVLLGTGFGALAAPVAVSAIQQAGNTCHTLAIGDLDQDGHLDIVVGCFGASKVTILYGTGSGSFQAPVFPNPNINNHSPRVIVLADVNADGKLDLVYLDGGNLRTSLAPGFSSIQSITSGSDTSLVVADVNADGRLDYVLGSGSRSPYRLTVALGNGAGGSSAISTFGLPAGADLAELALADIDGNHKGDIVAADVGDSLVRVFLNDGSGGFASQIDFKDAAWDPAHVAVADLDGDGRPDIVALSDSSSKVSVMPGIGASDLFCPPYQDVPTGSIPAAIALADFNGDGKLDVATADSTAGVISVFLGAGAGAFPTRSTYATSAGVRYLSIVDVNGDGKLDLVAVDPGNRIFAWLGTGSGTFTTLKQSNTRVAVGLGIGDLNGDGHLDLFGTDGGSKSFVEFGDGTGLFNETQLNGNPAGVSSSVVFADVNRDGVPDLLITTSTGGVYCRPGSHTSPYFGTAIYTATGNTPSFVTTADLDRDGKLDVVVVNRLSSTVSVLRGNGDGTFAPKVDYPTLPGPNSAAIADVNGDGWPDLVVTLSGTSSLCVFFNRQNGSFGARRDIGGLGSPVAAVIGDATGDGKPDLAVANHATSTFSLLTNRGDFRTGTWLGGGMPLGAGTGYQYDPISVSDGVGGSLIAWRELRSTGDFDIYAMRVGNDGSPAPGWPPSGVAISTAAGNQYPTAIVTDGKQGAIIAWRDTRADSGDVYAQRVDANGLVRWLPGGQPVSVQPGKQTNVTMTADGNGGAVLAWEDGRGDSTAIYSASIDSTGAGPWTANGVLVSTDTQAMQLPAITTDSGGLPVITWTENSGPVKRIHVQRLDKTGQRKWGPSGKPVGITAIPRHQPVIISDGSGITLGWADQRFATPAIYAQRLDTLGTELWVSGGVPVSTTAAQDDPALTPDGTGGSIIAWSDARDGNINVYAQRLDPVTGTPDWDPAGIKLCEALGDHTQPVIISDGYAGGVIIWRDQRGTSVDLYAGRVLSDGGLAWNPGGVPLVVAAGDQVSQTAVVDGTGGAIAAWQDGRTDTSTVYAARVKGDGTQLVAVPPPVRVQAKALSLAPPRPNPSRGITRFAFDLPRSGQVTLELYDVAGRRLRTLCHDRLFPAGPATIAWDGRDESGQPVASGVYFARVRCAGQAAVQRGVLLR